MRFGIIPRSVLSFLCLTLMISPAAPSYVFAQPLEAAQIWTGEEEGEESMESMESDAEESAPFTDFIRETVASETSPASNFELSDQEHSVAPLSGSNEDKLNILRAQFPAGKYWNHLSGSTNYPMETTTDAPCDSHETFTGSHRCNVFDSGAQCAGFAYLCYFKFHGYLRSDPAYSRRITGNQGIRVGDVIHLEGHYGFVWKVEGDDLYVFEANYRGRCRINMSRSIPRSQILEYWTPICYKISYSANGGSGLKDTEFVRADASHVTGTSPFNRNGAAFAGWAVRRTSTQEDLYTNGRSYQFFSSADAAVRAGYTSKAVVSTAFNLKGVISSGDEIELQAQWLLDGYRIAFDAQGASGSMSPLSISFDELRTLPACSFSKTNMRFAGWKVRNAKGEILCSKTGLADESRMWMKSEAEGRKASLVPVVFSDQAPVRNLSSIKDETITLMALWEEIPVSIVSMYRLYNPNSGEHFYTASANERDVLKKAGWKDEGIGWKAPSRSSVPVYRLYNPNAGDHHYTTDANERDALKKAGWKDEGIGWYSDEKKTSPLYRQYNPNAISGAHNFTTSKKENDALIRLGWKGEGISWYGL